MGPLQNISADDQKIIEELLEGKRELPAMEKPGKTIEIGTKVHPLGYRESLYGIVSGFKFKKRRRMIEVSFTHLKESGNKATKKLFRADEICLFEDRHKIYAEVEAKLTK